MFKQNLIGRNNRLDTKVI